MLDTHSDTLVVKQIAEKLTRFLSVQLVHGQKGVPGEHKSKSGHFVTMTAAFTLEDGNLVGNSQRHSVTKLEEQLKRFCTCMYYILAILSTF